MRNLEQDVKDFGVLGTEKKHRIKLCGTCKFFEESCQTNTDKHDLACKKYRKWSSLVKALYKLAEFFSI